MKIIVDDLRGPEIKALLEEHLHGMAEQSPPESMHALNLSGLRAADVTFWSIWDGDQLAGCGALKELDAQHAEVKSMRTAAEFLRRGVARQLLQHMLGVATERGYQRLSLETGTSEPFQPAIRLYKRYGFRSGEAFGDYTPSDFNQFFHLDL